MKPVSIVVQEDAMVPLDRWLATELSLVLGRPVPRGLTRKAIVAGLVSVGGRVERVPGVLLRRGRSVFVRSLEWLPPVSRGPGRLRVLFEDRWLIAVDKPAGLPTHETKDVDRPSLTQLVEGHVGRRVFVHHRLDATTSGVVLFAKAAEANASLGNSFAERAVTKTYVALVRRPPIDWPSTISIDQPILVADSGSVRVDRSGVVALTLIRVLERRPGSLLVEAKPVTGRKHQIRVHLASQGAPIVGDTRYGGDRSSQGRLMLHAERIELAHPMTGAPISISSPRPEAFKAASVDRAESSSPPSARTPARPREGDQPRGREGQRSTRFVEPQRANPARTETTRRKPARAAGRGSRR